MAKTKKKERTPQKKIIIQLNDEYRVSIDSNNLSLQKYSPCESDKLNWDIIGYFSRWDGLLSFLLKTMINNKAKKKDLILIEELKDIINSERKEIRKIAKTLDERYNRESME